MNKFICVCVFLLLTVVKNADAGDIDKKIVFFSGTVIDDLTGDPLVGASVEYKKTPYGSEIGLLETDDNGKFEAYFREKGSYSIQISHKGYTSFSGVIDLLTGVDANFEKKGIFKLKKSEVEKIVEKVEKKVKEKKVKEKKIKVEEKVFHLKDLNFEQGKSKISKGSFNELNELVKMLKENPTRIIQLEGHTDFRGSPAKNLKLSQSRVEALKGFIVSSGIEESRVQTKAFGGTKPLTRKSTAEARSKNRRVEVRILEE